MADSPNESTLPTGFRPGQNTLGPTTARVVSKNALANLARPLSAWLLVLILPPLLVRSLGKDSYAIWVLILQVGAYITLIDGAIQSAVGRYVAHAQSRNDRKGMSQMVSSALLLLLLAAVACALCILVLSYLLPSLMKQASSTLLYEAQRVLLIVGFAYALSLPFAVLGGIFVGFQKNETIAVATTIGKFVSAAGIAAAALSHMGLIWMALLSTPGILIQSLIYLYALRRQPFVPEISARLLSRAAIRTFFSFSAAILLTQFMSLLISGLDMPVVATFDFQHTAYYAIAATVSNALIIPFSAILSPVMPVAAGLHAVGSAEDMGSLLSKITRLSTCLLCLLAAFVMMGMFPLLSWWLNPDYAANAIRFAQILLAAQFVRLTLMPYSLVAFGAGQQRQMMASPLGEGIVNLICSLAGAYKFGAIGVAYGTLIGAFVGVALHFLISMKQTTAISISRKRMLREILRPTALMTLPFAVYFLCVRYTHTNAVMLILALVCTALAAILLLRLALTSDDRRNLIELIGSVLRRPTKCHV